MDRQLSDSGEGEGAVAFSEIPVTPPKKKRRGLIIGIIAVAAAVVMLPLVCSSEGKDDANKPTTAEVTRATIEKRIEIDGQVIPVSSYSLAFPIPASDVVVGPNIASVNVSVGDEVAAGHILAQLEGDNVDSARLLAPVDGVITEVKGAAGAPPPPGASIQMRTNSLEGEFKIGETDLSTIEPGIEATITVPVLTKSVPVVIGQLPKDPVAQTAAATLGGNQSGGATAGQGTASYSLTIPMPATEGLKPGLTARLLVIPKKKVDVLVVPAAAVVGEGKDAKVEILVDERSEMRSVEIGISDGRNAEVLSGLVLGDQVVLNPGGEVAS